MRWGEETLLSIFSVRAIRPWNSKALHIDSLCFNKMRLKHEWNALSLVKRSWISSSVTWKTNSSWWKCSCTESRQQSSLRCIHTDLRHVTFEVLTILPVLSVAKPAKLLFWSSETVHFRLVMCSLSDSLAQDLVCGSSLFSTLRKNDSLLQYYLMRGLKRPKPPSAREQNMKERVEELFKPNQYRVWDTITSSISFNCFSVNWLLEK